MLYWEILKKKEKKKEKKRLIQVGKLRENRSGIRNILWDVKVYSGKSFRGRSIGGRSFRGRSFRGEVV